MPPAGSRSSKVFVVSYFFVVLPVPLGVSTIVFPFLFVVVTFFAVVLPVVLPLVGVDVCEAVELLLPCFAVVCLPFF